VRGNAAAVGDADADASMGFAWVSLASGPAKLTVCCLEWHRWAGSRGAPGAGLTWRPSLRRRHGRRGLACRCRGGGRREVDAVATRARGAGGLAAPGGLHQAGGPKNRPPAQVALVDGHAKGAANLPAHTPTPLAVEESGYETATGMQPPLSRGQPTPRAGFGLLYLLGAALLTPCPRASLHHAVASSAAAPP